MSLLIRILIALQICIVFVAGCAVDDDGVPDTEITVTSDEAATDDAAGDDPLPTEKGRCNAFRLNNRASAASCNDFCEGRGELVLRFDNRTKVCICCFR